VSVVAEKPVKKPTKSDKPKKKDKGKGKKPQK
jgi:hypothetical protein